jgi:hypothetical protein
MKFIKNNYALLKNRSKYGHKWSKYGVKYLQISVEVFLDVFWKRKLENHLLDFT